MKGFSFSFDAAISLLLLVSFIYVVLGVFSFSEENLNRLYVLQKENDLLKVWSYTRQTNSQEMIADFERVFPGKQKILTINNREILEGKGQNAVSSKAILLNKDLEAMQIKLVVFLD